MTPIFDGVEREQKLPTIRQSFLEYEVKKHAITAFGFEYCGIIHCWNGDERLAYQYN